MFTALIDTPRLQESDLIAALREGRQTAFRTLVETYQDKVYQLALMVVQQEEEAEDVAQEVFIEVYQTIDRFREEARLSTWIYRITTSKALEHHRKRKAKKRFALLTSLFGADNSALHHPVEFHHPGVALEQKEEMQQLFRAVDKLADNQKIAFTLHYLNGMNHKDISEVMEVSTSAVESLLHRAKQHLRKQLATLYKDITNS